MGQVTISTEELTVEGWIEFTKENAKVFNEYAKANCWCRFDDGTICRYQDEQPMAILTHFKIIKSC